MREIKFRAWDKGRREYISSPRWQACYNSVNCVLEQYTGWKDKHNKEIYEGDLLRFTLQLSEDIEAEITDNDLIFQVFWSDNGFYIARPYVNYMDDPQNPHGTLDMYEIIGNIHEGRQKNNG